MTIRDRLQNLLSRKFLAFVFTVVLIFVGDVSGMVDLGDEVLGGLIVGTMSLFIGAEAARDIFIAVKGNRLPEFEDLLEFLPDPDDDDDEEEPTA